MNYPKVFGWLLLIVGLIIIGWTLYSSYNFFTAKAVAPEFFETPEEEEVLSEKGGVEDMEAQLEQMIGEQLKGILPADSMIKLLNLIVWSLLAFVLIFGGTQISSLGIKLIRR